jgi:hypothetical protein
VKAPLDVSQETLAGNDRHHAPRVSFFMNKFMRLGLIGHDDKLTICSSLLSEVFQDPMNAKKNSKK